MEQQETEAYIRRRVHELYYGIDMNCARTTLTILSEVLFFPISKETMASALGLHGAGGFRAQCGLVEGGLMFLGLYGTRNGKEEKEIVARCYSYAEDFTSHFGSLTCMDLRPNGFQASDPPHLCETLTAKAISFTLGFVLSWIPGEDA